MAASTAVGRILLSKASGDNTALQARFCACCCYP